MSRLAEVEASGGAGCTSRPLLVIDEPHTWLGLPAPHFLRRRGSDAQRAKLLALVMISRPPPLPLCRPLRRLVLANEASCRPLHQSAAVSVDCNLCARRHHSLIPDPPTPQIRAARSPASCATKHLVRAGFCVHRTLLPLLLAPSTHAANGPLHSSTSTRVVPCPRHQLVCFV